MKIRSQLVILALAVLACRQGEETPSRVPVTVIEQELIEADRDFATATADSGVDAWVAYFAPEGAMISGQGEITGAPYIRAAMEDLFSDSTIAFTWEPRRARAAESGELGYTVGDYRISRRDSTGTVVETLDRGMYVTVWRRQPDGSWKVVADVGTSAQE